MKNSNRRFYNNKCEIFESLSQKQIQQLCFKEIRFTDLTGFLFLLKTTPSNNKLKVSKKLLTGGMKESLFLSQN